MAGISCFRANLSGIPGFFNGVLLAEDTAVHGKPYDIRERSLGFAADVVTFCQSVRERGVIIGRLAGQLVDAAGSIGANLEEAYDGQSKADFISKNCIALKEAREARYWLRLISLSDATLQARAAPLIAECSELVSIIGSIIRNARSNPARR